MLISFRLKVHDGQIICSDSMKTTGKQNRLVKKRLNRERFRTYLLLRPTGVLAVKKQSFFAPPFSIHFYPSSCR